MMAALAAGLLAACGGSNGDTDALFSGAGSGEPGDAASAEQLPRLGDGSTATQVDEGEDPTDDAVTDSPDAAPSLPDGFGALDPPAITDAVVCSRTDVLLLVDGDSAWYNDAVENLSAVLPAAVDDSLVQVVYVTNSVTVPVPAMARDFIWFDAFSVAGVGGIVPAAFGTMRPPYALDAQLRDYGGGVDYDGWGDALRAGARRVILLMSDADVPEDAAEDLLAGITGHSTAGEFGTASEPGFVLHAAVGGDCSGARGAGDGFASLASLTGGTALPICEPEAWSQLVADIATGCD